MGALPILYTRQHTLSSWLIRLGSWWGPWSHCAVVDREWIIECRADAGRVKMERLDFALKRASAHAIVLVQCPDPERAIEWARSTVGQRYDWGGAFGIPFRQRQLGDEAKWYCSEHVEAALAVGGRNRWRHGLHGITPSMSYFTA